MPPLTERAFVVFYEGTMRSLWTYVYRSTSNAADTDDIVQEAFCRLLQADVGRLSTEDQRRYLFRVASNLMADRWRRATREPQLVGDAPDSAAPLTTTDDEVIQIFNGLKPRERALLWLAYVEEDNHTQIAETLGVGRSSVKVLLARARTRLRALLGEKKHLMET